MPHSFQVSAPSQPLTAAVSAWLGGERCHEVELYRLPSRPDIEVYCLPRSNKATLSVILVDLEGAYFSPIAVTVDQSGSVPLDYQDLGHLASDREFWSDILSRQPICLYSHTAPESVQRGRAPLTLVELGLDACRALSSGWSPPVPDLLPHHDISQQADEIGNVWESAGQESITRAVGVQTSATHWPMPSSPLVSDALPVPRRADGCSYDSDLSPGGRLHHLECAHMHVKCTLPCREGYKVWSLSLGNWVHAARTRVVTWQEVQQVGGFSVWELPGVSIHGPTQMWQWPDEVSSLAGQCGHLFLEGRDPRLSCTGLDQTTASQSIPPRATTSGVPHNTGLAFRPYLSPLFAPLWFRSPTLLSILGVLWLCSSAGAPIISGPDLAPTDTALLPNVTACPGAWCYDLACHTAHFAIEPSDLAGYLQNNAPDGLLRLQVWRPFQGPTVFDVSRDDTSGSVVP